MSTPTHAPGGAGAQAQDTSPASSFRVASEDAALVERLRNRDETSFLEIVQRYHGSLVRLAQSFVNSRAAAEEVAQETWVGVLQGIDRFEGRSSLKTWIFRILINRAKTRAEREGRSLPFSAFRNPNTDPTEPAVSPERFREPDDEWPDHWATPPQTWGPDPERRLLAQETREFIQRAVEALPPSQREVITLRDMEGGQPTKSVTF